MGAKKVFDPARAILPDHFSQTERLQPNRSRSAVNLHMNRTCFSREVGRVGVEHAFLPENGLILPGEIVLGADSHTCTHGAMGALATGVSSTDLAAAWALGETWLRVPETMKVSYEGTPSEWICSKRTWRYSL